MLPFYSPPRGLAAQQDLSDRAFTIAWRKFTYWWSSPLLIFGMVVMVYGIGQKKNQKKQKTTSACRRR